MTALWRRLAFSPHASLFIPHIRNESRTQPPSRVSKIIAQSLELVGVKKSAAQMRSVDESHGGVELATRTRMPFLLDDTGSQRPRCGGNCVYGGPSLQDGQTSNFDITLQ